MLDSWLRGLEEQVSKDTLQNFKESAVMRRRFRQLIENEIETVRSEMRNKEDFSNASWPFQQANHLGYERALFKILKYLED